jgi:Ca2+-transporting ATPase
MATIVNSPLLGKKVIYVKGAPEIVLSLSKNVPVKEEEIHTQLLQYQNQAMRTLGFAYAIIEDDTDYIKDGKLIFNSQFLGYCRYF